MQTIVTTSQPHDLLALVPQFVGFRPENSLVLVAFRGKRTCGAYRVDLPEPSSDTAYKRMATTLIGMLCKVRGADGVIPVVYTDDRFEDCGGIPRETFAMILFGRARSAGFAVKDALCVAADGWGSYFDDPGTAFLPRPLSMIDESTAPAAMPSGQRALSTPREQAELPKADMARKQRVGRAVARLRAEPTADVTAADVAGSDSASDAWQNVVAFADRVLEADAQTIAPELAAEIILTAELPSFRDVLLFEWAWGFETGLRTARLNEKHAGGGVTTPEDDGVLGLAGMGMPQPDPERITRAIALLRHLAACAPRSTRPPLLTMLAWLHWALGSGSTAGLIITQARAIDARYGLAELLDSMLQAGMLPEWSFEPPAEPSRDPRVVRATPTRP